MKQTVVILGSTGSIGRQSLEVIEKFPEKFEVIGLSAHKNEKLLQEQIKKFSVPNYVLTSKDSLESIKHLTNLGADIVINALTSSQGLKPSLDALESGSYLALANKESLVAGGFLLSEYMSKIYPIDSEHSAMWQCLMGENINSVKSLILTASGGPFLGKNREELAEVSLEEVLAHPTWQMGPDVTINSATLVNKALEMIEAHYLFGLPMEKIEVVIHPQSLVHSMVRFVDGSIKAQISIPDMKLPISLALGLGTRLPNITPDLDLLDQKLEFFEVDDENFPSLELMREGFKKGPLFPTFYNALNQELIHRFKNNEIKFTDIFELLSEGLEKFNNSKQKPNYQDILETEQFARKIYTGTKLLFLRFFTFLNF